MQQFQGFYEDVSSPLLLEVDLRYPGNTVDFLTTNHFSHLFNGSEIVVAGRLTDNNQDNFMVEVFGEGVRRGKWLTFGDNAKMERKLVDYFSNCFCISSCLLFPAVWGKVRSAGQGQCSELECCVPRWGVHLWGLHRAPVGLYDHPAITGQEVCLSPLV